MEDKAIVENAILYGFMVAYTLWYLYAYLVPFWDARIDITGSSLIKDIKSWQTDLKGDYHQELHGGLEGDYPELKHDDDVSHDDDDVSHDNTDNDLDLLRESATEKLNSLSGFSRTYSTKTIQETVAHVKAKYPNGEYQHIDIYLMPSVSAYMQKQASARNMAGVFILIGISATMFKLNGVVTSIGNLSNESSISQTDFLTQMGAILSGVQGAFGNSIFGIVLIGLASIIIGFIHRKQQEALHNAEQRLATDIVPLLQQLTQKFRLNLAFDDILTNTASQLKRLDRTVNQLTLSMEGSIVKMNHSMVEMLNKFTSFESQYIKLDGLVKNLSEGAKSLSNASDKISIPYENLQKDIRSFIETVSLTSDPGYRNELFINLQTLVNQTKETYDMIQSYGTLMGTHLAVYRKDEEARIDALIKHNAKSIADAIEFYHTKSGHSISDITKLHKQAQESYITFLDASQKFTESAKVLYDTVHKPSIWKVSISRLQIFLEKWRSRFFKKGRSELKKK